MRSPKIRFKGYSEDWEQRKLGEITELKSASRVHKDEWTSNGVPFYRSSDVMAAINGTENEKAFISEELYEKLSKVSGKLEEGDILVTGGGSVGNPYIVPDNKPLYTKDADLLWIKNKGKFHPYFLYEFFFSPTFRNYLGSISHVGTIAHYTITQLSDTPICLPSFEEQKKVGEYFQSLDNLITLHQRKCDETKTLKKYMLQKMFPQNGEKVPEIRFDGFTEDWEQRKLGDISSLITKGTTPKDKSGTGEVNFIKVENINDFSGDIVSMSKISLEEHQGYLKRSQLQEGDILFSIAGTLGRVTSVNKAILPANTNQALSIIRLKEGNLEYVKTCLKGNVVADFIRRNPTIGAQPNLSLEQVSNLEIEIPSEAEQEKIGLYFSNLDNLITLHHRKLEKLEQIKQAMLHKMFV